jgi:hypothetical protein
MNVEYFQVRLGKTQEEPRFTGSNRFRRYWEGKKSLIADKLLWLPEKGFEKDSRA